MTGNVDSSSPTGGESSDPSRAYAIALRAGARHHGWYLMQRARPDDQLRKGIRSLKRQISQHLGWIANPPSKDPMYPSLRPSHQVSLVLGWEQDIERQAQHINILQGILEERRND